MKYNIKDIQMHPFVTNTKNLIDVLFLNEFTSEIDVSGKYDLKSDTKIYNLIP